jgi:hypothetical protein
MRIIRQNRIFIFIFLYFILWCITNFPGLRHAWLYLDDWNYSYKITNNDYEPIINASVYKNGRPGEYLWLLTFHLDGYSNNKLQNIIIRFGQGLIHSTVAFIVSYLLWKMTKSIISFFAVLPFLLWPFNSEAVLWRSAAEYPLSALLSLLGLVFIDGNNIRCSWTRALGILFINIAVLTNQQGALAAFVVWMILISVSAIRKYININKIINSSIYIIIGYLSGGIISFWLTRQNASLSRTQLSLNIFNKIGYLVNLNKFSLLDNYYYSKLTIIIHLIIIFSFIPVLFLYFKDKKYPYIYYPISFVPILLEFFVPYGAVLLVSESWPSWRVMYLSPFLICGAWFIIAYSLNHIKWVKYAPYVILLFLLINYCKTGYIFSGEYQIIYNQDLTLLHSIKEFAKKNNLPSTSEITVANDPISKDVNWNPYHVTYIHGDSPLSAYLVPYAWPYLIKKNSMFVPVREGKTVKLCIDSCANSKTSEPMSIRLISTNVICVCP